MAKPHDDAPPGDGTEDWERFPPEHAFVVQLPASADGRTPSGGRVEHVLTGHSARFESLDGLAEFFAAELAKIRAAAAQEE